MIRHRRRTGMYKVSSYLDFNASFHHYKHGQHSGCVVRIVARKETLVGACIDKLAHLGSTNVVPLTSCCPTCVFISVNFKQNPAFQAVHWSLSVQRSIHTYYKVCYSHLMDGGWCTPALQSVLQPLDGWWLVHTCISKCATAT